MAQARNDGDRSRRWQARASTLNDLNQTVDEPGRESGQPVPGAATPTHIGRYRVERLLGQGGFGLVYLAHDDQLQRLVAIKVPHARLVARPEDAEAYLTEARTVATNSTASWIERRDCLILVARSVPSMYFETT